MYIVAIYRLQGETEQLAAKLAAALGRTVYEMRGRVIATTGGPMVVAHFARQEAATECVDRLNGAGFSTLLADSEQVRTGRDRRLLRSLRFGGDNLELVDQTGEGFEIPYREVQLLLRGTAIEVIVEETTQRKKKFSPTRALATAGLVMRKTVVTKSLSGSQERLPFCHIHSEQSPPLVLRQDELDYSVLGADRQLSREANFNWMCGELRRRCPDAVWNDRLLTRAAAAQLLGSSFSPEQDLDLALDLTVQSCLQLA